MIFDLSETVAVVPAKVREINVRLECVSATEERSAGLTAHEKSPASAGPFWNGSDGGRVRTLHIEGSRFGRPLRNMPAHSLTLRLGRTRAERDTQLSKVQGAGSWLSEPLSRGGTSV